MEQSLSHRQALLLGVVALVGLGLAIYGLLLLGEGQWPWSKALSLRVGFSDIKGVSPGTRVRVKGNDAGQVRKIQMPDKPDGQVMLELRLDAGFADLIHADASAQIANDGIFGGKILEINPGSPDQPVITNNAEIKSRPTQEMGEVVDQLGKLANSLDQSKGSLGEVVTNTKELIRKTSDTMESFRQVAEGAKEMPLIGGKIKDQYKILNPPGSDRKLWWFKDAELFIQGTPEKDRLSPEGEKKLKALAHELAELTRKSGANVVVFAFADPAGKDASLAQQHTNNQSLVTVAYLRSQKAIHKEFGVWEHDISPLGLGIERPAVEDGRMPAAGGLGVALFTPRNP